MGPGCGLPQIANRQFEHMRVSISGAGRVGWNFQQGHPLWSPKDDCDSKHWKSAAFSGLYSPAPNCLKSNYLPPDFHAFSTNLLQPKCSQVRTAGVLPQPERLLLDLQLCSRRATAGLLDRGSQQALVSSRLLYTGKRTTLGLALCRSKRGCAKRSYPTRARGH